MSSIKLKVGDWVVFNDAFPDVEGDWTCLNGTLAVIHSVDVVSDYAGNPRVTVKFLLNPRVKEFTDAEYPRLRVEHFTRLVKKDDINT